MLQPLRTGADFWRRFYAPQDGVSATICHVFRKAPVDQLAAAYAHTGLAPVGASIQVHTGNGRVGGSLDGIAETIISKATRVAFTSVFIGRAMHMDRDSPSSLVPRLMLWTVAPKMLVGGDHPSMSSTSPLPTEAQCGLAPTVSYRCDGEPCRLSGTGYDWQTALIVDCGSVGPNVPIRFAILDFISQAASGSGCDARQVSYVMTHGFSDVGCLDRVQAAREPTRMEHHDLRSGLGLPSLRQAFDLYQTVPSFINITDVFASPL
uniref:Uncharacterized protein n=1 Tax=Hemiselmis tepida TaxID=464990 RepID=A0A7S0VZ11_9CRYP